MGAMSVAVYSRLGGLLRARGLDVEDLRQRIVADTGLEVNARALAGLASDKRVTRPDIEVAGAAATALAVRLDDLFDVQVVPDAVTANGDGGAGIDTGEWNPLGLEQSRRLDDLLALRDERDLDEEENAELHALIDASNHAVIERDIQEIAQVRGEPADRVRAEIMANVDRLSTLWEELEADPVRMAEAVREAKARRREALAANSH
jgi:hypothetical protein